MASATTPPGDPTDVVRRRAAAFLIDTVLLGTIGLAAFASLRYRAYSNVHVDACTLLRRGANSPICLKIGSRVFLWHPGAAKTALLLTIFLGFLNGVVLQSITGSSVGKLCLRLSVISDDGGKPHPLRMFGRWVFLVVDIGFCLVGCFMVPATHPHRRIGDFVFGTYVVAMMSVGRPVVIEATNEVDPASLPGVGSPSAWSAPPTPARAKTALAASTAGLAPPLKTPPGTTPTAPGEWGAVARPAPVVRSPGWATPPPSDGKSPPIEIEPSTSPKWAAPPVFEEEPEAEAEVDTEAPKDDIDAEPDAEPEVEDEAEAEPEAEDDATTAEAASEAEAEPEAEAEADTDESESETETEPEPDLSEWSAVATASERRRARRKRSAKASAGGSKDESWWDAALSSGDSDAEADPS